MAENFTLSIPHLGELSREVGAENLVSAVGIEGQDETTLFRNARQRRVEQLVATSEEIAQLEKLRDRLNTEIAAFDVILGEDAEDASALAQQSPDAAENGVVDRGGARQDNRSLGQSSELTRSVEATVEVLRREGTLHYREIYDKVTEMGVKVTGQDPAATLLSRFSRDPRIYRVSKGTYDILEQHAA